MRPRAVARATRSRRRCAVARLASCRRSFAAKPHRHAKMNTRPIPSTREALPVIGCGTYVGFDHAPGSAEYALLARRASSALFDAGGKVLDSSPMYGRAEATTGELLAASGRRAEAFLATKVWTQGRDEGVRQMEASLRAAAHRPHRPDADPQPGRLAHATRDAARVEGAGRIRYLGITHYTSSAYAERRGGAARGEARLPADQLCARRPRGGAAPAAAGGRARRRGDRQHAVRRRRPAAQLARQAAAGVGRPRSAARAGRRCCSSSC